MLLVRLYACLENGWSYFLISPASWYQAFPGECWKFVKCSSFTTKHKNLVLYIVNVNKSVGNSAHFRQNDTSSPAVLKIMYTKQCWSLILSCELELVVTQSHVIRTEEKPVPVGEMGNFDEWFFNQSVAIWQGAFWAFWQGLLTLL